MSFIVKTWTPRRRGRAAFSRSSRLRTPMSTVCSGSTLARSRRRGQLRPAPRRAAPPAACRGRCPRRRRRRVHVAVRVDPDQAERPARSRRAKPPSPPPIRRRGCDRRRARAAARLQRARPSAVGRAPRRRVAMSSMYRLSLVAGVPASRGSACRGRRRRRPYSRARSSARRCRRCGTPTAPCRRRAGRRRGRAERR